MTTAVFLVATIAAVTPPRYAGRTLLDVLAELRAGGLALVYSDAVVAPELRVADEPGAREPRAALEEMLRPHGLGLKAGPRRTWLVVVVPSRPRPSPSPGPGPSPSPGPTFHDSVEVTGGLDPAAAGTPVLPLPPREVGALAGAGESVFRALQTLPGVAGTDDLDSRLSVRGGGPDQNLTVMDGIEVHNPYRLSGLASAFNPESVERFELMAGAFDVRYGDRLSSILVVSNRAGRADVDLGGAASLALTDASLLLEGGFPGSGDGSWLVAARRTYYDLVAERFVDARLPAFSDVQAKLTLDLGESESLSLLALASSEGTRWTDESDSGEDYAILTRGRNRVAALRWSRSIGSRGHLVASGGHTYFREGLDFRGVIESSSRRSNGGEASSRLAEVLFVRDVSVGDLAARVDTTWRLSRRAQLDAGIEAHRLRPAWNYDVGGVTLDAQRNGTRLPYPSGLAGAGLPDELDSALGYGRGAAYVQQQVQLGRTRLRLGVRLDRSGLNRRTSLQPRAGADVRLGPRLAFELGAGVYAQTPGYEKTFQADDFLDLGEARGLDNERALHASAAIAWRPAPGLELRAEAFGRRFEQLLVGRLETEAESRARIARYDFPPFPAWIRNEIPRRPVLTVHPTLDGRGEAWGVDAILSRRAVAGRDRLTGWLAYTWSRAEREAWGRRFPFDYDRRHALSLVGNWRPSRALALGATLRAASGFPYTPAVGARLAAEPDIGDGDGDGDTEELLPARDARGEPVFQADYGDVTNRNRARLPAYFRLDARLTYRPGGQRSRLALYLDVINLTGRANAGQIESALVRDPGADRPRVEERREVAVPFLPSLGVHWRF